ncbi:transposase [Desulfopila sp. IMCC35006]|uniref:DDE-type integrase/transposase/recombinase n=1 Tax=Desulfopila sp. IMCC35006 TaxID=2569542 RepID=UPI0010ACCACD|nr:DDE-type integrase/transposase/recombinase [Desulfopila sp. IMCC35006]TKB23497.1 transposase [Desulfopila sp. IMCC35006]
MTQPSASSSPSDLRVQAVLALLRGEPAAQVSVDYGIDRSSLYKFRSRAIKAICEAVKDQPRGPKLPHNHVSDALEKETVFLCQVRPSFSSYRIAKRLGPKAPSPRTIQRIRKRHHLARLTKRQRPLDPARKLTQRTDREVRNLLHEKFYLGPDRLAWDLLNSKGIHVSPSTFKRRKRKWLEATANFFAPAPSTPAWRFYERHHPHSLWHGDFLEKITLSDTGQTAYHLALMDDYSRGYVFCDLILNPDVRTTIRAIIVAMRQWQVIPKAIIFDNGSGFKGNLLSAFCEQVGIRLIHTAVYHPQTNGKLERGFRDDMRDYYKQHTPWLFEPLRRDLPAYVHYRNYVRGHRALDGRPSITRLNEEHSRAASPEVLDHIESYARYEIGRRTLSAAGGFRMFNREVYVDAMLAEREVVFFESLEGLEARMDGQCVALLRDYRTYRQKAVGFYSQNEIPPVLYFEPCAMDGSPRIAVANRL